MYRVTWFLRLIRIDVSFEEQELKWRVRIAWKSFGSEPQKSGHTDTEKKKTEDRPVKTDVEKTETAKIESEKEEAYEKEKSIGEPACLAFGEGRNLPGSLFIRN